MKGRTGFSKRCLVLVQLLPVLLLGACATAMEPKSEIDGQLEDGGWVNNVPGQAHTHRVVLAECPEQPVITRHTHNHLQSEQMRGPGPHKHRGCFICPPKNRSVKRILSH